MAIMRSYYNLDLCVWKVLLPLHLKIKGHFCPLLLILYNYLKYLSKHFEVKGLSMSPR